MMTESPRSILVIDDEEIVREAQGLPYLPKLPKPHISPRRDTVGQ
jgi:hypothetical protein